MLAIIPFLDNYVKAKGKYLNYTVTPLDIDSIFEFTLHNYLFLLTGNSPDHKTYSDRVVCL